VPLRLHRQPTGTSARAWRRGSPSGSPRPTWCGVR